MQTTERPGVTAASTAVVMWGAGNVVVKYIPMSGLSIAFNRLWLGAVVFTALYAASGGRITWRALKVATPGGIAFGLDVAVFFSAIKHTSVADASVIGALQPALVFLAAGRLFGERVRPSTLVWTVIAIAAVIGSVLASSSTAGRTATGDLLSIGAVIAWSAYFVASKRARQQLGAMEYQACMTIVAAIVLTPIALIGAHDLVIHTASNLGWVAIMVAVPGGGHLLMNWAHAHVPIVLTSLLTLGIPIVATLGAAVFLGEGTTAVQLACIAVVMVALVVVVRSGAPTESGRPFSRLSWPLNMAVRCRRRVRHWATYPIGAVTPIIGIPRPAVVLTTGRAGSDLLISLLDSHPNIVCGGELLRAMSRVPPRNPRLRVDGEAAIAAHEARVAGKDVRVFGWKLLTTNMRWFPVQFPQPQRFLEQSTEGGLLIVLRRRDYLAQALSWIDAERREYHYTKSTAPAFEPFLVDPEQLLAQVYAYELEDQWLADVTAGLDRLEITYEDDLVDETRCQAAVACITDRLALPFAPTSTDLVAVAPRHPVDRIANIDQVVAALEGTRYRRFLPA